VHAPREPEPYEVVESAIDGRLGDAGELSYHVGVNSIRGRMIAPLDESSQGRPPLDRDRQSQRSRSAFELVKLALEVHARGIVALSTLNIN